MLAVPDSIYCSAHTTSPLPNTSRNVPVTIRVFQSWRRTGAFSPNASASPASSPPAIRKRTPAIRNGGKCSTPIRMAM
jgi:hypothetical protein